VTRQLENSSGPVIAASDYVKLVPDMVARWIGRPFTALGTDGFGRSDTRESLRRFFEVDAEHIVVATLSALVRQGQMEPGVVNRALQEFGIGPDYLDPWRQ
jgi:pyruvate dehydrogenase E1 component